MPDDANAATDAALSSRVRQAVSALNEAVAAASRAGLEAEITLVVHESVGSPVKRQIVSARVVRPIASA